jgi:hypothetical protein
MRQFSVRDFEAMNLFYTHARCDLVGDQSLAERNLWEVGSSKISTRQNGPLRRTEEASGCAKEMVVDKGLWLLYFRGGQ